MTALQVSNAMLWLSFWDYRERRSELSKPDSNDALDEKSDDQSEHNGCRTSVDQVLTEIGLQMIKLAFRMRKQHISWHVSFGRRSYQIADPRVCDGKSQAQC